MNRLIVLLWLALAGACSDLHDTSGESRSGVVAAGANTNWRSAAGENVRIDAGDPFLITTGPHAVVFPADAGALEPPYSVEASLEKRSGRLYEGYGLVFGGDPLDVPEPAQRYSYFLVRSDGAFLIKRREGEQVRVIRDWTAHSAIQRNDDTSNETNRLRVDVGEEAVTFRVNGVEVAGVPAAALRTRGMAGVRVAHGVQLAVAGFRVVRGTPSAGGDL
jgi:hypothetical protein